MIKTRIFLSFFCLSSLWIISPVDAATEKIQDIQLDIGIIQRLGSASLDKKASVIKQVTINSIANNSLQVNFPQQTDITPIKTDQVVLKVEKAPLTQPKLEEKLILSDRATFETAEDSANSWRKLGIEVEIAQPGRWQVWAKRDIYGTPLVRRWLLHSLEANGYTSPYLDSKILHQEPDITLEINGKEYNHDEVEISSDNNLVSVNTTNNPNNAFTYGGSLELQPNAHGDFSLVNHVPLETYLRGVVPYEIGASAPAQAVAAQTIIARTYALRNLRRFAVDDYQLCATVHCQVYKGLEGANPTSDSAITKTAGLVLTYDNELIDALYSSTTGGVTASFEDTWNGSERPYLQPVVDSPNPRWDLIKHPLDSERNFRHFIKMTRGFNETGRKGVFRWQRSRSIANLTKDLRKYLQKTRHPMADFKTIKSMEIFKRSRSGRIRTLEIETEQGKLQLHKNEIRSALQPPRSTFFYLEPLLDQNKTLKGYAFVGGGFGHGVGLSQYGSYNLANIGWSAEKILAFYYPQTTLKPLDETVVFWQEDLSTNISQH